ncbi:hypothetical protein CLNEO_13700 [Anaerotignum neopropionicum]|uniref:Uncharacterized protein n=1 Tax=Anaerotignum neopropionicum TaxID=36847 RepID=A0A136WGB0_9FIRM|nr:hypothetical protein [Anaerotignum neopropionicum]KXL53399.1 hypothetical protein CLNEO_13700 [Anaerotignum neopropionicum]
MQNEGNEVTPEEVISNDVQWVDILKYLAECEAAMGEWGELVPPEQVSQDENELMLNLEKMGKCGLIEGANTQAKNLLEVEWTLTREGYSYLYQNS